jgi:lysophospholipase L1-like esterase
VSRTLVAMAVAALMTVAGCGGPTSPAPPANLSIQCPASFDVPAADGIGAGVTFTPTVTGGRAPTTACSPASGTTLPVGEANITCTASDSTGQAAACSFAVRVVEPPRLQYTRFLAFGDSITEGVVSPAPSILRRLDAPQSYPSLLQVALAARYTAQSIVVLNRGLAGERLARGRDRLPGVLDQDQPEVLLLLEGINNLRNVETDELADDMDAMIRSARRRGVVVLVAELLPISDQREAGSRRGTQAAIRAFNEQIRRLSHEFGLGDPVDLHTPFVENPSLLGADGLHPTEAGYVRIAEIFFAATKERWETAAARSEFSAGAGPTLRSR